MFPVTYHMARAYQNRLLKNRIRGAGRRTPRLAHGRFRDQLLLQLGDSLVAAGRRLQQRHQPVARSAPKACRPSI
jgi:hypothetical protein